MMHFYWRVCLFVHQSEGPFHACSFSLLQWCFGATDAVYLALTSFCKVIFIFSCIYFTFMERFFRMTLHHQLQYIIQSAHLTEKPVALEWCLLVTNTPHSNWVVALMTPVVKYKRQGEYLRARPISKFVYM